MLVEVLKTVHSVSIDELLVIFADMSTEDLISYWAYVASFAERDHVKDFLCKEELLRRQS